MPMTIRQIMSSTPPSRRHAADYVKVTQLKVRRSPDGNPMVLAKTIASHTSDGVRKSPQPMHKYVTTLEILGKHVRVSCSCLAGDTLVLTDKGWKTMLELAEPKSNKLTVTYLVNGKPYQGTAPFHSGKKPTWRLTFDNGLTVTSTADHRFLESVGDRHRGDRANVHHKWTEARDLTLGSKVLVNSYDAGDVAHNKTFYRAMFLGMIMGDGTVSSGRPYIGMRKDPDQMLSFLAHSGFVQAIDRNSGYPRVSFTQQAVELMARAEFKNKESVTLTSHTQLLGYLSGLLVTDGSVAKELVVHGGAHLKQVQKALISFGYYSAKIILVRPAGTETNKGVSTKDLYKLKLSRQDAAKLNGRLVLRRSQQKALDTQCQGYSQTRDPYSKLVKIEYAGRQHVYDISVPEVQRFVANGFIVHNCDDFWSTWEYALAKRGAANSEYSNGEPPVVRNPKFVPGCCKHIFRLSELLIEQGKL